MRRCLLGIYREPSCSPGRHRDNDAAILELVAGGLEARGHRVVVAAAHEAWRVASEALLIFSMSRAPTALEALSRLAAAGRPVVNVPASVLATARSRLARRDLDGLDRPRARVVPTARALRSAAFPAKLESWWVKGGDLYASRREDVRRVETPDALERVLDDFERRGISTAVLQEHVEGREFKFYAVGRGYFFWLDAEQPSISGGAGEPFHPPAIACGAALGLEVFGGDIVVGENGRATLIDLNDWPSFAPCRDAAADAIAAYLEQRLARIYAGVSPAASAPSTSA